ncbi:MAG: hypothetical protein JNK15_01240 [Planctomycetes bacterium]|nr:hypothetical protein [Planctomycetota bacterium]
MRIHAPALCLLATTLLAQEAQPKPLTARSFLPDEHRMAVHADIVAMRDRGIWDELQASVMKLAFKQMEKELGFPLASLDRVTMVGEIDGADAERPRTREVLVLEGNTDLAMHDRVRGWEVFDVGGRDLRRSGNRCWVQPDPKLQVQGDESLVRPVLEGKPRAGMPCADVMSLLSGRKDQLAWFVFDVTHPKLRQGSLGQLFPGVEWPAGDAPTFVCLRVVMLGEDDDPHLGFEAVVRHAKEGDGLAVTEKAADEFVARLRDDPKLRLLKPVLAKAEKKRDRTDVVYRADFGRARDAVGLAATLVLPMFSVGEATEIATPAAAAPAAPAEPKK